MVGIALKAVCEDRQWPRRVIAKMVNVSESLVNEWVNLRRRVTDAVKPTLARKVDDGRLYMAIATEATGGVSAPYLDGRMVDNHRLVAVDKAIEEMQEAIRALQALKPVFRKPPKMVTTEEKMLISDQMMESVEAETGLVNMLARLAREYDFSLADLYDQHQEELIEKGYLEKEKTAKAVI